VLPNGGSRLSRLFLGYGPTHLGRMSFPAGSSLKNIDIKFTQPLRIAGIDGKSSIIQEKNN